MLRRILPLALVATFVAPAVAHATPVVSGVSSNKVVAGTTVTVTGTVDPAAPGEQVQLEQLDGSTWTLVAGPVATDATGSWSLDFVPRTGGELRATQITGTGGSSEATTVAVVPKLLSSSVQRGRIYPFLGARAAWRVAGGYPNGRVRIELSIDGRRAGTVRATIRNQRVSLKLPVNGVGRFQARLVLPARGGLHLARFAPVSFRVRGERVGSGSSSTWNRSLRAALRFRGFHAPGGRSFDYRMGDAVVAFHKAYGRARTTTFEASDWTRLTRKRVQVRDRSSGMHIEIDKSRQILMQVTDGRPTFVIHVSSGATGNTPAGHWRINWKGNWVPSLYGSLLYKSMSFVGSFAIHGYPSVPTTPASHGCVRVPMWIAATLYSKTPVGTKVYIYEGPGGTSTAVGQRSAHEDVPELTGVDPDRWADERL
ncbi:MAG: L,D-transpeptidase [Thermoleophilia bacterium]|nr:L,D-transpeptidase [Thermoleophilia bacterium]